MSATPVCPVPTPVIEEAVASLVKAEYTLDTLSESAPLPNTLEEVLVLEARVAAARDIRYWNTFLAACCFVEAGIPYRKAR